MLKKIFIIVIASYFMLAVYTLISNPVFLLDMIKYFAYLLVVFFILIYMIKNH